MTVQAKLAVPVVPTAGEAAQIERGNQAQSVLDNPAFARAFEAVEAALIEAWKTAPTTAQREECHQMVRLQYKLKSILIDSLNDGLVIQEHLEWANSEFSGNNSDAT